VTETVGGEVVSADSRQIYRGMAIGSGAPSTEELKRVPHHLVGTLEPHVRLSAGEYARLARQVIGEIMARGRIPIVVGGSGLYIRALIDGLAPIPPSDPQLRQEIEQKIDQQGMEAIIDELRMIDPEYAGKVGPNDRKRLIRALEVWETTGKNFTSWHDTQTEQDWCKPLFFGLDRPRSELHGLIARRVENMLESGWVDEVRSLKTRYGGLDKLPPSVMEAVGYKDVVAFLRGDVDFDSVKERIIISTRQFAKRQLTWFRADKRVDWSEESGSDASESWMKWILKRFERIGITGNLIQEKTA